MKACFPTLNHVWICTNEQTCQQKQFNVETIEVLIKSTYTEILPTIDVSQLVYLFDDFFSTNASEKM